MTHSWLCDGCSAETLTATPTRPPRCCACGRTGDVLVNVTPERIYSLTPVDGATRRDTLGVTA